jgi:hypothetical protein
MKRVVFRAVVLYYAEILHTSRAGDFPQWSIGVAWLFLVPAGSPSNNVASATANPHTVYRLTHPKTTVISNLDTLGWSEADSRREVDQHARYGFEPMWTH